MVTFHADSLTFDARDLNVIMTGICDWLGPTVKLKDIVVQRKFHDNPVPFKGVGILIQAALQNILDNAIKYSPEDSEIIARVEVDDDITLSITDQGRGFGGVDTARLTTRYARGANVDKIVGSGFGLTIADEVVRAHGGHIKIAANPKGGGASVSIIFPIG